MIFIVTFLLYLSSVFNYALIVDRWKQIDREVCLILRESNREKWDSMLLSVETYTKQLNNLTLQLPANVQVLWRELDPILRYGRPRFITVPVIGSTLKKVFNMTDIQIYRVWVVRTLADQEYDRFIQRMMWMKENKFLDFIKNMTSSSKDKGD